MIDFISPYALLLLNFSRLPIISQAEASYSPSEVHYDGDDKAKESKSLGENEDEDHTHNHVFLSVCTDSGITNDSDGEAGSEG